MNRRRFIQSLTASLLNMGLIGLPLHVQAESTPSAQPIRDEDVRDYLVKMRFFDMLHSDDIYVTGKYKPLIGSVVARLKRIQSEIGHGNFHLAGFDDIIKASRSYDNIGKFTAEELSFMEKIFYRDASQYGFLGEKPCRNISDTIDKNKIVKIKGSGHYLYKDDSLQTFTRIKQDLGEDVILTSGLRGIAKQFLLFLDKALRNDGNLSLASRSLAPPGYSFHSSGDFDVGQISLGRQNFSEIFTQTDVYHKLIEHGYANLRYQKDNLIGVRFEPWHIKLA